MCGGKLNKERIFTHLKCGYCADKKDICTLEKYTKEKVFSAYALLKELKDEKAEQARKALLESCFSAREKIMKKKTAREKIAVLKEYIKASSMEEKTEELSCTLKNMGANTEADYFLQVKEGINEVISQAEIFLGDREMTVFELADILESGFASKEISLIPILCDQITVGDIAVCRLLDTKILIVVGVNDGVIPTYDEKSDILTPRERAKILDVSGGLTKASNMAKQKIAVYRTFCAPSEKLFLLYSKNRGEGKAEPSALIEKIKDMCAPKQSDAAKISCRLFSNVYAKGKEQMCRAKEGRSGDTEYISLLLKDENAKKALLKAQNMAMHKNIAKMSEKSTEKLYQNGAGSVTRYESYFSCPFKHFLKYGLRPEIIRESDLDYFDMGSFVHESIDTFCKKITDAGLSWKHINDEKLNEIADLSIEEVKNSNEKYLGSDPNIYITEALKDEIKTAISAVKYHFAETEGDFLSSEQSFCFNIGGQDIKGIIDRIDSFDVNGKELFRIIDYKTGKTSFSINDFYEGLSLQLFVYIIAAKMMLGEEKQMVGANYLHVAQKELNENDKLTLLREYELTGIYSDDKDILKGVYGEYEKESSARTYRYIKGLNIQVKKDGTLSASAKNNAYSKEEVDLLCEYTKKKIKEAAQGIKDGDIKISPKVSEKGDPCENCEYIMACHVEESQREKDKNKITRKDAIQLIEESLNGL